MRRASALLIAWLLGSPAVALAAGEANGVADFLDRPIASLSFRGDAPVDEKALAELTNLAVGQTLTSVAIQRSLQMLFATRLFSDLWIEAQETPQGPSVIVAFYAVPRVHGLAVAGSVPSKGKLLDRVGITSGDPWFPDQAPLTEQVVRRFLREQGYFASTVSVEVEDRPGESDLDVRLVIDEGQQAAVGPPRWLGSLGTASAESLAKSARLKPGKRFREAVAREDEDRYLAVLRKAGHLRAEARYEGVDFDETTRIATARYRVDAGPRIVLQVEGVPASDVLKHPQAPWVRGEVADTDSLKKLTAALKETYQRRGHFHAKVESTSVTHPDEERITFRVSAGERLSIASVRVNGASAFKQSALKAFLKTQPRGLLETGRAVDADLAADREALSSFYRERGYANAKALGSQIVPGTSPRTLDVVFGIEEGNRVTVRSRRLEGVTSLPAPDLERTLVVKPGATYHASDAGQDVERLRAEYLSRGFADVRVEVTAAFPAGSDTEVDVSYSVAEGKQLFFGKTVIRGNRKTALSVVRRELPYKEGEPLSFPKLLEAQQNLSRLGVFSRVELSALPQETPTSSRPLLLTLSEGKPWSILYGLGAEWDSNDKTGFRLNPRFSLGASYANLFGRAILASVDARYSIRETRLIGTLLDRSVFNSRIPVSLTLFATRDERTINIDRAGGFLQADRRLNTNVKTSIRLQYEIVKSTLDPLAPPDERQNQNIKIASVGLGFAFDNRPDPFNPRSGLFVSTDFKYAFPLLSASANFLKGFFQATTYRPVGPVTAVLGVRLGGIEPLGPCDVIENPSCVPNLSIPVAERFFSGGRTTHRAFAQDELAIESETKVTLPDRTVFLGGNGVFVGNLELRIPIDGDLGVALFLDAGNLWGDYRSITLKGLRYGAGAELQYLTPVGPLRLGYAWKLDRKEGESPSEFILSIGYPF